MRVMGDVIVRLLLLLGLKLLGDEDEEEGRERMRG